MKRIIHTILLAALSLCFNLACEEKLDLLPSTLSVVSVTEVGVTTAKISSAITKSGNQEILDYGFTVSLSADAPVIGDGSIKKGAIDRATPTPVAINASLTDLQTATEYYVHAFAMLQAGPIFSEGVKFKTSNVQQPVVKTQGSDSVRYNSARLMAVITSKGTYPISEYGIVWSGAENPTTESGSKYSVRSDVATVPLSFATHARGLSPNTTYHFRAYVISNGVTSYGVNLNFRTDNEIQPKVLTGEAKPAARLSYLWGEITARGSSSISQYGICWSTATNPTVSGEKLVFNGDVNSFPKSFGGEARNLSPGTTYYYRAFVTMNGVTSYGDNRTFRTAAERQPTVVTGEAKPSDFSAFLSGSITAGGDAGITQYGVCWSLSANPTIDDNKYAFRGNVTSFPRNFVASALNLSDNTFYNYRAFVTMNGVTTYGVNKTFKTPQHVN